MIEALTARPEATETTGDAENYLTFREIRAKLKVSDNSLRRMLRALAEDNRLECKRVPRVTITGDVQMLPGYRLIPK